MFSCKDFFSNLRLNSVRLLLCVNPLKIIFSVVVSFEATSSAFALEKDVSNTKEVINDFVLMTIFLGGGFSFCKFTFFV